MPGSAAAGPAAPGSGDFPAAQVISLTNAYQVAHRLAPTATETAVAATPGLVAALGGIALLASGTLVDAMRRAHKRRTLA